MRATKWAKAIKSERGSGLQWVRVGDASYGLSDFPIEKYMKFNILYIFLEYFGI